jgi:hypothetical protein
MTKIDHHDGRALDLLTCTYWGQKLGREVQRVQFAYQRPVIDYGGDSDEHTAVQAIGILLDGAAMDIVERPIERVLDEECLDFELGAIKNLRDLAESARAAAEMAERIADILQAPFNADESQPSHCPECGGENGAHGTVYRRHELGGHYVDMCELAPKSTGE